MRKWSGKEKLVEGARAIWGYWGSLGYYITPIFEKDIGETLKVVRKRSLAGRGFASDKALWCPGLDPLTCATLLALWDVCFCITVGIGASYGVPTSGVGRSNCQSSVSGVLNTFRKTFYLRTLLWESAPLSYLSGGELYVSSTGMCNWCEIEVWNHRHK